MKLVLVDKVNARNTEINPRDLSLELSLSVLGPDGKEVLVPLDLRKIDVVYKDDFDVVHIVSNIYLGGGITIDNRKKPITDSDEIRANAIDTLKRGSCKK